MFDNKKLPFLSEAKWNEIKERYAKCRAGLSAAFYSAMVFVVIFGLSQNVYAGFPAPVPYLIIALFLLMAFVRMYESLVSDQPATNKKKKTAVKQSSKNAQNISKNAAHSETKSKTQNNTSQRKTKNSPAANRNRKKKK